MSEQVVYECPECGDRKLVCHSADMHPQVWCSCDGFNIMDIDPDSLGECESYE